MSLLGAAQRFSKQVKAGGGSYNRDGVRSIGGRVGIGKNYVGGAIGMDKSKPFGSVNVNGKVLGSFGPQGY